MNPNSTESDHEDPHFTNTNSSKPSGLSNLFNNNNKPLNAFIITSKPPLLNTRSTGSIQQDMSPSSFSRSSAYFTASLPNSISNLDWEENQQMSGSNYTSSDHYLSRTISSSNYFDNQSDYEVILDDGSRQKRTISLSTIQPTPSFSQQQQQQKSKTSFLENWIYSSATKNRNRNHHNRNER